MNNANSRFLSFATVALLMMSASGCVCVTGGGGGSRGNVTFTWTFQGRQCFEVPDVTTVAIQIPGQTLQNDGRYPCTSAGTAGITLLNFRAGTYSYTIQGLNSANTVIYSSQGTFTIDGNVTEAVDLTPTGNAKGSIFVTWTFPTGTTVTCANLQAVQISIDGAQPGQEVACTAGTTSPGVEIQNLAPGQHSIDLAARDANGFFYYRKVSSFVVIAGGSTSQQYQLDWAVGSLALKWTMSNGVTQLNCAQAGISTIRINLRDSQGNEVYGVNGVDVPCLANALQGTRFPYLYAGNYTVFLQGVGTGSVLYKSNFTTPPQRAVVAGQFPDIDNPTPTEVILMQP